MAKAKFEYGTLQRDKEEIIIYVGAWEHIKVGEIEEKDSIGQA